MGGSVTHPDTDDRTVITVWFATHPFPGYLAPLEKMAGDFEKAHPEFRLDVVGYDFRELPAKVAEAVTRGDPPDIAEYYHTAAQLARDTRGADGEPLFTSVAREIGGRRSILGEPVVVDDLVPAVRDYYTYDGDLASMPITATTTLLYSNATLLRAAGLAGPPATWGELEKACDAVTSVDGGPGHGVTWPVHGWLFQQAVAEQGALLAGSDNGRGGRATTTNLASPEMIRYARWWQGLHDKGRYLYTGEAWDWLAGLQAFVEQRVAFAVFSSAMSGIAVEMARGAGFDVEVSSCPRNGEVRYAGHMVSGQSLWLRHGLDTATKDGALAFLQFLAGPANAADWHRAQGFIPVTNAAFDLLDGQGWFQEHPYQRAATEQLAASDRSPAALGAVLGNFGAIQRLMAGAMEDVLAGGADPAARFRQADTDAQNLLTAYTAECEGPDARTPTSLEVA
jgi:sn-glycerol 3-phosphate transport system substrate-binding protein